MRWAFRRRISDALRFDVGVARRRAGEFKLDFADRVERAIEALAICPPSAERGGCTSTPLLSRAPDRRRFRRARGRAGKPSGRRSEGRRQTGERRYIQARGQSSTVSSSLHLIAPRRRNSWSRTAFDWADPFDLELAAQRGRADGRKYRSDYAQMRLGRRARNVSP